MISCVSSGCVVRFQPLHRRFRSWPRDGCRRHEGKGAQLLLRRLQKAMRSRRVQDLSPLPMVRDEPQVQEPLPNGLLR